MSSPIGFRVSVRPSQAFLRWGFTLVELLVVIAVIVVLLGITLPAFTSMRGTADVRKSVYDLADALEQARAYAMANSTFVYVGVTECDASQNPGGNAHNPDGIGRVAVAAIASRDGTRGYDLSRPGDWKGNYTSTIQGFVPLGKVRVFENLHLVNLGSPPNTGGMVRPALADDPASSFYNLGNGLDSSQYATPFDYPVGTALTTGRFSFTKVIQFDPQGTPRIQSTTARDRVTTYLEIGLEQSHGTAVAPLPSPAVGGDIAAVQLDGLTGSVHVYRP